MRSYQFWDGLLHYFPGSPLPSATWLSSAPGGQFEVIRLAPGAVCHCRGHDFLDIACRGYRFVIANLHADEPSQVRSASPAVGALQQVTRTVPSISGKRLSGSKRLRRVSRASRGPSGCRFARRDPPVRCHPIRGTVVWGRVDPTHRTRRRRNRTWRILKWGPDRDGQMVHGCSFSEVLPSRAIILHWRSLAL